MSEIKEEHGLEVTIIIHLSYSIVGVTVLIEKTNIILKGKCKQIKILDKIVTRLY